MLQVFEWIQDGSVASGRVALVNARPELYITLSDAYRFDPVKNNSCWCCYDLNVDNHFPAVKDSGAEIVVIYGEFSTRYSREPAKKYHEWLGANHPESRQRVLLLGDEGMWDIKRYIQENSDAATLNKVFTAVADCSCSVAH